MEPNKKYIEAVHVASLLSDIAEKIFNANGIDEPTRGMLCGYIYGLKDEVLDIKSNKNTDLLIKATETALKEAKNNSKTYDQRKEAVRLALSGVLRREAKGEVNKPQGEVDAPK